jgi:hypothetical protein
MSEKVLVTGNDKSLAKAKTEAGMRAFKKLESLLTKKDIDNIEKSYKLFRARFKLG